jgi:hypothetical protein
MSIIEGGVFIIAGCLGTMRVLLTLSMPSRSTPKNSQDNNIALKEGTSSSGEAGASPRPSLSLSPKPVAQDGAGTTGSSSRNV